jgi:LuxR family transcriptional regulator, quorum-sensing system regulator SolR
MSLLDRHLHTSVNSRVVKPLRAASTHNQKVLTEREREILAWIAEGKSDASIGQILCISSKTVNYHVENAKRKFAVATRIQAVLAAIRQDLLS